jgi:hypothetical protein
MKIYLFAVALLLLNQARWEFVKVHKIVTVE